ncbi:MAG: S-layer homology domain-containing protein, partial [Clostridia bacterium]|nr:S-layer homology domain-containing protein [Clostridia bacterium]
MRKLLCVVLAVVLLLGTIPAFAAEVAFADLNGHWARNYVLPLAQDGVISGKAP